MGFSLKTAYNDNTATYDDDDSDNEGDDEDDGDNDDYKENVEHQVETAKPHCDQNRGCKELYQENPGNEIKVRKILAMISESGKSWQWN